MTSSSRKSVDAPSTVSKNQNPMIILSVVIVLIGIILATIYQKQQFATALSSLSSSYGAVITILFILLGGGGILHFFHRRRSTGNPTLFDGFNKSTSQNNDRGKKSISTKKSGANKNQSSSSSSSALKNVWEVGKGLAQKGAAAVATTTKNINHVGNDSKKGFGSSYYYAHNNPNATGGYKDGLRMEDYRMNGPRLLSKGGQAVVENDNDKEKPEEADATNNAAASGTESDTGGAMSDDASVRSSKQQQPPQGPPPIMISKYLWDDPGDSREGIAIIRIDKLPAARGESSLIDWKDIASTVEHVSVDLWGENGLLVKINIGATSSSSSSSSPTASSQPQFYQLRIKELYGSATKVEAVVKTKRLLVKIHKNKNAKNKKANLAAWPRPHKTL